ncbi:MAG: hypothetical protein M5U28_20355 [Sandaracinaceae bacterium]|nr:hypothetical protein [Sandaracinaceae bacterium]
MRYLCVHCDKTFTHEDEAKKPRCPTCMRKNGLEPVAEPKQVAAKKPWLGWAIAGGALAAAGVAYAIWASQTPDAVGDEVPLAPLDRAAVLGHLRHEGVDARDLGTMLVPSEAVEAWAERAAGGASGAEAIARAIHEAIRDRAEEGAFERWSFGVPREAPIAGPDRVIEWLGEDGAHHHLYPIEVAALMTSALRALDVEAMVAEAIRFPGDRSPPDPSGQLGYFVVAVYPGEAGEGEPAYFDPYGGRTAEPEARVLTDLRPSARRSARALHLLSRESDPERAMEASSQALQLDERSPTLRAIRGAILIVAGHADEGMRELSSAKQLRPDAPRRNLLASIYLAPQFLDLDAASQEVSSALEEYSEFAPGRATLAAIHLARQETDEARTELQEAERLDPQLHMLPQLWASYYAGTGEIDRAVQHAREAIRRNPSDVQAHLFAARIYRQAARYDLMRQEAHEVLERTPPSRRAEMTQVIRQLLGPTALEPVGEVASADDEELEDDEALEDDEELGSGGGSLTLESPLLGGAGGTRPSGPSLLGDGERPSLMGGGAPGGGGLQLGGGGGGGGNLRLNLGGGGE